MNAPFKPRAPLSDPTAQSASVIADGRGLSWAHAPSPIAWSVMCFGGKCPRTGFDQPNLEVSFHKKTRPNGYGLGLEGILYRANDYARMNHRSDFAVMNTDGSTIYAGPVLSEIDAPRVFDALCVNDRKLEAIAEGQRAFKRRVG